MNEDQSDTRKKGRSIKSGCGCLACFIVPIILLAGFSQGRYAFVQEPMVDAARAGDIEQVNRFLNLGADVDGVADDEGTGTALIGASAEGHADVVRLLIRRGADVNMEASYFGAEKTPLEVAASHPEIVAILKKAGAVKY